MLRPSVDVDHDDAAAIDVHDGEDGVVDDVDAVVDDGDEADSDNRLTMINGNIINIFINIHRWLHASKHTQVSTCIHIEIAVSRT